MPPTDAELVWKLVDSTQKGRINWQKTAITDQYAAAFGGKWTVTVDKADGGRETVYWLSLNDAGGHEILRIGDNEDSRMPQLFEMARRHALRVNEAVADLLKELDQPPS
jgi:hypothetical protein